MLAIAQHLLPHRIQRGELPQLYRAPRDAWAHAGAQGRDLVRELALLVQVALAAQGKQLAGALFAITGERCIGRQRRGARGHAKRGDGLHQGGTGAVHDLLDAGKRADIQLHRRWLQGSDRCMHAAQVDGIKSAHPLAEPLRRVLARVLSRASVLPAQQAHPIRTGKFPVQKNSLAPAGARLRM